MGARSWLALLLAAAGGLGLPGPARAQTGDVAAFFGQAIVTVELTVEGVPRYPQTLLARTDLQRGRPFSSDGYRSAIKLLMKRGGFESMVVEVRPLEGGVGVVFRAVPAHPVTAMEFRGSTGMDPDDLQRAVRDAYVGLPAGIATEVVRDRVLEIMRNHGFPGAAATVEELRFESPPRTTLAFNLVAGPAATIGAVEIVNPNKVILTDDQIRRETGAVSGLPYRPQPLADALQRLVDGLKRRRYYTATASPVEARPTADGRWDVKIEIDPGPIVVLQWDRNGDAPPDGDLTTFVPIAQQHAYDDDLLNDSAKRIAEVLKADGYADATVSWTPVRSENRLELTYRVTRGSLYRVNQVVVPAGLTVPRNEILRLLDVRAGDVLDASKIGFGLGRIDAEYWGRGYYRARATATQPASARPSRDHEVWVDLTLDVVEGPRGVVSDVRFVRTTTEVPDADLHAAVLGDAGQPYVRVDDVTDQIALETLYANRGYRNAKVAIAPSFSGDGRQVTRTVQITEGPQFVVHDIQVVGAQHITERAILEEVVLHVGQPFSESARLESQRRISNIGVFKRVYVDQDPDDRLGPASEAVHVIVAVVEAPDTSYQWGGGVEAGRKSRAAVGGGFDDRLEFSPRGFFGIGQRNLGGRNRSIDFLGRVSLSPKDEPSDPARDGKGYAFSEYRASVTYRERRAFHTDTDWLFGVTSERAIRNTFNFTRQSGNVEFVRLLDARTTATAKYRIDVTELSDVRFSDAEKLDIDRIFAQVRLSTFGVSVLRDHRNDSISPSRGFLVSGDTEIALRAIGSEVGYTKTFVQAQTYRMISRTPRVVVAVRGQIGVAHGFERSATDENGQPILVSDLPASQRFFAGGSTTVRGFQLDRLGAGPVLTNTGLSLGGNGLVIGNAELRTNVARVFGRTFSVVQFLDGGNVFAKASDINLRQLRGSAGMGFRYDSPIGPIRVDVGYKLSRNIVGGRRESAWEYHLSFGEIF